MACSVGTRKLLMKLRNCDGLMQSLIDGFQSPKCEVLVAGKDIQFAFLLWDYIGGQRNLCNMINLCNTINDPIINF